MRLRRHGGAAAVFMAGAMIVLSAGSCGRTKPSGAGTGGAGGGMAGTGTGGRGAGGDSGGAGLVPCLDRPDDLPRPPAEGLPCDLVPPNLAR